VLFWLLTLCLSVVVMFGFVVVFGSPYLPSHAKQTEIALDLLDLQPGQTLLDLGSGDGRVLLAAARRGWNAVGIELNPVLVVVARIVTFRYRKQVHVLWGSYWTVEWPRAEGIFTFMLPKYMAKLDRRIAAWHTAPLRLASYAFVIPGKRPLKQKSAVFLYEYR